MLVVDLGNKDQFRGHFERFLGRGGSKHTRVIVSLELQRQLDIGDRVEVFIPEISKIVITTITKFQAHNNKPFEVLLTLEGYDDA
jgi:hypothetical protein